MLECLSPKSLKGVAVQAYLRFYELFYARPWRTLADYQVTHRSSAPYKGTRKRTQLLLKQSCEQNVLSLPIFKQVGQFKVPASFGQSRPMQAFFTCSSAAMAKLLSGRMRSEGLADDNGENSHELPQKGENIAVILGTKVRYLSFQVVARDRASAGISKSALST